jgi:hypothetical protein
VAPKPPISKTKGNEVFVMKKFLYRLRLRLDPGWTLGARFDHPARKAWAAAGRLEPWQVHLVMLALVMQSLMLILVSVFQTSSAGEWFVNFGLVIGFSLLLLEMCAVRAFQARVGDQKYTFAQALWKALVEARMVDPTRTFRFYKGDLVDQFERPIIHSYSLFQNRAGARLEETAAAILRLQSQQQLLISNPLADILDNMNAEFVQLYELFLSFGLVKKNGYGPYFAAAKEMIAIKDESLDDEAVASQQNEGSSS